MDRGQDLATRSGRQVGLTETHIAIARLLALDVPDTVVAVQLHVSERTLRRYVRHLQDFLGVSSRCALGARVVIHGWLDTDHRTTVAGERNGRPADNPARG